MTHIKLPVRYWPLRFKPGTYSDGQFVKDSAGLSIQISTNKPGADEPVTLEIVAALNTYRALIAQRDALRDVLNDVLRSIGDFMTDGDPCPFCGEAGEHYFKPPEPQCICLDALALVREDGDA